MKAVPRRRSSCWKSRAPERVLASAQEVAALAQAFAGSALASAAFLYFSGALAQESAVTLPEPGALTEKIAALTTGVPALAHAWARRPPKRGGLAQAWGRAAQSWAGPSPARDLRDLVWAGRPQEWALPAQAWARAAQAWAGGSPPLLESEKSAVRVPGRAVREVARGWSSGGAHAPSTIDTGRWAADGDRGCGPVNRQGTDSEQDGEDQKLSFHLVS